MCLTRRRVVRSALIFDFLLGRVKTVTVPLQRPAPRGQDTVTITVEGRFRRGLESPGRVFPVVGEVVLRLLLHRRRPADRSA